MGKEHFLRCKKHSLRYSMFTGQDSVSASCPVKQSLLVHNGASLYEVLIFCQFQSIFYKSSLLQTLCCCGVETKWRNLIIAKIIVSTSGLFAAEVCSLPLIEHKWQFFWYSHNLILKIHNSTTWTKSTVSSLFRTS